MAFGQTPVVKGSMTRLVQDQIVDVFEFQYNPTIYSESMVTEWYFSQAPGQYLPVATFSRFGKQGVKFQLFMYGRERGVSKSTGTADIRRQKARLKLFASPGPRFGIGAEQFISPGRVMLVLGEELWDGVINSLDFTNELFNRQYNVQQFRANVVFTVTSTGFANELAYLDTIRSRAGLTGSIEEA